MGKQSAIGQSTNPTRPAQSFIGSGSINAAIRCRLPQSVAATSGERLRGRGRYGSYLQVNLCEYTWAHCRCSQNGTIWIHFFLLFYFRCPSNSSAFVWKRWILSQSASASFCLQIAADVRIGVRNPQTSAFVQTNNNVSRRNVIVSCHRRLRAR